MLPHFFKEQNGFTWLFLAFLLLFSSLCFPFKLSFKIYIDKCSALFAIITIQIYLIAILTPTIRFLFHTILINIGYCGTIPQWLQNIGSSNLKSKLLYHGQGSLSIAKIEFKLTLQDLHLTFYRHTNGKFNV